MPAFSIRIASCGLADVLTYNPSIAAPPTPGTPSNGGSTNVSQAASSVMMLLQLEDLSMLGKLIFALCCNNVAAVSNLSKAVDIVSKQYSADLKVLALFCISKPGLHKVRCAPRHAGFQRDMLLTIIDSEAHRPSI